MSLLCSVLAHGAEKLIFLKRTADCVSWQNPVELDGSPTFAVAYVGRKRYVSIAFAVQFRKNPWRPIS